MSDDAIVPFPEREPPTDLLCGPFEEWRVVLGGRTIPNLTGWREGGKVWLCVDRRFGQPFDSEEAARNAAVLIAQAMAIGAGYAHYEADAPNKRPFAPISSEIKS